MMSIRDFCLAALVPASAGPALAAPPPASNASELIIAQETRRPPFAELAEWLAFVTGTSGGAEAGRTYRDLYSKDDYYRSTQGKTITISRIP